MKPSLILSILALALAVGCGTTDGGTPGDGSAGSGGTGAGGSGGTGGTGTGGTGVGGSGGELPSIEDVSGTVVDEQGAPVSGARVFLDGDTETPALTAADGKFAFDAVKPPYDLTVQLQGSSWELRGLTRPDPVVPAAADWKVERHTAIAGAVSAEALAEEEVILLTLRDAPRAVTTDPQGNFDDSLRWFGPSEKTAELVAARLHAGSDGSLSCLATGARTDLAFRDQGRLEGLTLALSPFDPAGNVETDLTVDTGAYDEFSSRTIAWFEIGGARFGPPAIGWVASTGKLRFPGRAGIAVRANDVNENLAVRIVRANAGGATEIRLPAEVALRTVEPAAGATGVSLLPTLVWSPVAGAKAYWVAVGGMNFVLPGTENQLTLPDYGSQGAALLGGEGYGWQVRAFLDAGFSADEVTDGSGMGLDRLLLLDEVTFYESGLSWFQTAP